MAISQHTRFENHMDIASPETVGDAQKISDFFDENPYDDDFEAKLSQTDKIAASQESVVNNIHDSEDKGDEFSYVKNEKDNLENDSENIALSPTMPPLHRVDKGENEGKNKESNLSFDRTGSKSSRNSNQNHSIQQAAEKVIAFASALDAVGDVLSGGAMAVERPNKTGIDKTTLQSSIISAEGHHDTRSIEDVFGDLGYEIDHHENNAEETVIDAGQAIESIGNDDDNQAEIVDEQLRSEMNDNEIVDPPAAAGGGDPPNPPDDNEMEDVDEVKDQIAIIDQQPLDEDIKKSFLDGKYISAVTNEDIILYRIYGGGSEKEGQSENLFLTPDKPKDRMFEKENLALSNVYIDKNGNQVKVKPNTREMYAEVIVTKGSIINIGYVASQNTLGGQELKGGGLQIVTKKHGCRFGVEQEIGYSSNYIDFDKQVEKLQKES